jgi:hypothetical protein
MSSMLKRMSDSFQRNVASGNIPKSAIDGYGGYFVEKGKSYETGIVNKLKTSKKTDGTKAPLIGSNFVAAGTSLNPDVQFYANRNKDKASVEVKTSLNAQWLSKKLKVIKDNNSLMWEINEGGRVKTYGLLKIILTTYKSEILKSIKDDFNLPTKDGESGNRPFYDMQSLYESFEDKTFTSKFNSYTRTNQKNIVTGNEIVNLYKKYLNDLNTYYIQIKGKGLYYVGEDKYKLNDNLPQNKKIKEFSIQTATLSLKKAYKSGGKYQLELRITASSKSLQNSNLSLDNVDDLKLISDFVY